MRLPRLAFLCPLVFASVACEAYVDPEYPPQPSDDDETEAPEAQEVPVAVDGDTYADTDPSALTDYHAVLSPFGSWVEDPLYGTVWVPNADQVGTDFTPYATGGHWAYDDDYVWVSDYEWGWAPFHYGRWVWIRGHGWSWIPGRRYAGAWVSWRTGDDAWAYVGWAPLPPLWIWQHGIATGIHFTPWEPYVFAARRDVFAPTLTGHLASPERAAVIASNTRPYVQASPTVGGHPFGQASMRGPTPASLKLGASDVVHPVPKEAGLAHALQFARPSTARQLGARPAMPHVVRSRPIVMPGSHAAGSHAGFHRAISRNAGGSHHR